MLRCAENGVNQWSALIKRQIFTMLPEGGRRLSLPETQRQATDD
ncbi:hypothetical protein [Erwinia oleae]|nr:hypothetical protein [Erwinia oleae]